MDGAVAQVRAPIVIANEDFDAEARVLESLRRAGKLAVVPPAPNVFSPAPTKRLYKAIRYYKAKGNLLAPS